MTSDAIGPVTVPPLSIAPPTTSPPAAGAAVDDAALRAVAQKFESAFLAEMMKHAGFERAGDEFGGAFLGGHGERAFKSLLTREYADALSQHSRFGLAEQIYADLKRKVAPDAE